MNKKDSLLKIIEVVTKVYEQKGNYQIKDKMSDGHGGYCWYGALGHGCGLADDEMTNFSLYPLIGDYLKIKDIKRLLESYPILVWNDMEDIDWQTINEQLLWDTEDE